jgi:hypothetical protein
MGPRDERQPVVVVERLTDILPKRITSSSRRDTPTASVVGVRPEEIAHRSFVGYLLDAVDRANVV